MMKNRLDKDCVSAARVTSMYAVSSDSKRFVAAREASLEQTLDDYIKSGKQVAPEEMKRLGKIIVDMCKPVLSEVYIRICKK